MPYGLYMSADGAHAQATRLEVIAHNLANVETTGFKRELAVLQTRYAEEIEEGLAEAGAGEINDIGGGIEVVATKTDFGQGPLKDTGLPTDLAIRGEGFFVVGKDGEQFLTRAGNFHVNARGELVTQYGGQQYAVLDDSMAPIVLDREAPWEFTVAGAVKQAGATTNLALVKPQSYGDLARHGENVFRPLAETAPLAGGERSVAPGYLEGSGVQPTTEMIAMIEASRLLEANLNMMKSQDEMLGGLVNRLMRV
ncbi:MAG: flagellar hook-basal body protein [Planctomycetaceae bacterium]|nr:flagellar hook-basal body protein [Planctomycetaceae bacterium]